MSEKIGIQAISELITSKAGREYFTLEDQQQKRYVCFVAQLKNYCKVGSEIEADITPGKSPDDSPRLDMVYVDGKPVVQLAVKPAGRSYGKSKEELLQQRQLAEAQNRSIQAQTALNRAVDLALGTSGVCDIAEKAREFYQLLQSLTQISEAKVIYQGVKDVKASKEPDKKSTETTETTPRVDDIGGDAQSPEWADWLKENIVKADWTKGQWLTWLQRTFNKDFGVVKNLEQAVEQLAEGQRKLFFNEIESRLKNK